MKVYRGVGAIGDVKYEDGTDHFEDIKKVFKVNKEVNLKRDHDDAKVFGKVKKIDLDKKNKSVFLEFDEDDLDFTPEEFENAELFGVSPQWIIKDGKIVGIDHFAVGNSFEPICTKCNIKKEEKIMDDKNQEEDNASSKDEISPEEELKALRKRIKELESGKEEPAPEDDGTNKLNVKPDKKQKYSDGEELKPISWGIDYQPSRYKYGRK